MRYLLDHSENASPPGRAPEARRDNAEIVQDAHRLVRPAKTSRLLADASNQKRPQAGTRGHRQQSPAERCEPSEEIGSQMGRIQTFEGKIAKKHR
ncbi:MAG TPA: hypothetical protein VEO95_08735, partial [Chthoniobacteraceae bacterium]|nr:hypothetical protein [Chthoniobacteraceae bacterium]